MVWAPVITVAAADYRPFCLLLMVKTSFLSASVRDAITPNVKNHLKIMGRNTASIVDFKPHRLGRKRETKSSISKMQNTKTLWLTTKACIKRNANRMDVQEKRGTAE